MNGAKSSFRIFVIIGLAITIIVGCSNSEKVDGVNLVSDEAGIVQSEKLDREKRDYSNGEVTQREVRNFVLEHTNVVEIVHYRKN
ncbi:hypothetical protein BKP37_06470 [Anaerobacillus alkalilacustris]|uniref:Uncharacterized protein n=1 Tax=Anaerobacillus alkalilacustris TaxID=393763 RepID=A0A1S2LVN1_9BACI|nr:hypothetical protein [Anaerobacillus alkalilacustris]OIJ15415.1 hypothetical protein BKP37_06470 [Anaerobacillus alkalilacustris]